MPVINGVYLKDFPALPSSVTDANIIPIAISGNQIAYRTTVAGIVTDARVTSKLLTGLSVTGSTILATDTILQAFGKVQNQLNGKVSSVGLTMPAAFNVANSPITSAGTLAVTAAGVASQYIRGDGALADFPTSTGGGSSVSYYLNGSVSQGTIGGNAYKEMNKTPVIGTGTDFTINANGYIAQFITDANDPASLLIPAGNWNVEMYFSASSNGGTPSFYVEVYKYDGTAFTLLGSSSATPEGITNGTAIDIYYTSVGIPETVLTITDRLAIRVYVTHSGRTITLHTEDNHLSEIVTTFSNGLTTLNGLTKQAQYFAVGSTGTDFAIVSSVDTHTFNLPTASASNRGALSSADWTTFNNKAAALSGTINTIAYWDSSTTIASLALATYPSLTELSYVKGVTSAIQTQLNAKQATITLTTTGTSGAATFSANTLNIPQYQAAGTYVTSVTGTSPIVSSGGTTPAISIPVATTSVNGYLSSTDWTTFNGKQGTITLTTTGTSGAATFSANTLNIPQYADSFVGTVTSVAALTLGTTGTDLSSTVANGTTTPVITLQVPTASAANRGALSSADWSTFNGKQSTITLTTTGTSGAATFSANTLNIPNYGSALTGYLPLSGGTLTGALIGTSATFSGAGKFGGGTASYNLVSYNSSNGTSAAFGGTAYGLRIDNGGSFGNGGTTLHGVDNTFTASYQKLSLNGSSLEFMTDYGTKLTIANSGAATFSGIVNASAGNINIQGANQTSLWLNQNAGGTSTGFLIGRSLSTTNSQDFFIYDVAAAATRLVISSGGNVGIGTTSPTNFSGYTTLTVNGTSGGVINCQFNGTDGLRILSQSADTQIYEPRNVPIIISTNATERMRITSGGNVLIGTATDNGYRLQAVGSGSVASFNDTSSGDVTITLLANGTFRGGLGADANYALKITGVGGTQVAVINTSTGAYTATSDRTLKKNISDSPLALPVLNQIKIRQYNWKSDDSVEQYGVIAQELYEVAPTYVSKPKKETDKWGVSKAELVPLLIKAIQEQQAQIEELKALIK